MLRVRSGSLTDFFSTSLQCVDVRKKHLRIVLVTVIIFGKIVGVVLSEKGDFCKEKICRWFSSMQSKVTAILMFYLFWF